MPEQLVATTIRWGSLGPLLLSALLIMGSPGPATLSLVAVGSAFGARRALPYLVGIVVGTTLVLLAVATGVTAAILAVPGLDSVVVALAAVYIVWLAYRVAIAPPLAARTPATDVPSVAGGTLFGIANPKAWVAITAVFASSHLADGARPDAVAKVGVLTVTIVVINASWLAVGASLAPVLQDAARARIANRVFAASLVVAAALTVVR